MFAGPDPDCLFKGDDENLAVTDPAGFSAGLNRFDNLAYQIVANGDFNFDFRYKIHDILGATVQLGMPFLAAEALSLH